MATRNSAQAKDDLSSEDEDIPMADISISGVDLLSKDENLSISEDALLSEDDLLCEDEDIPMSDIPEDSEATSGQVLSLARRITSLATDDEDVDIDPELSHRLALSVKPYVDRLVALSRLLNPVGRIIEKREQIDELRGEIAQDIASVEDASQGLGEIVDTTLITELQTELAAVKRDRKLFAEDDEEEEEDPLEETVETEAAQDRRPGRVYYPDEGIRVRDLSRVTHHPSLGVTPNW